MSTNKIFCLALCMVLLTVTKQANTKKAPKCTSGPDNLPCLNGGRIYGREPNCRCKCKSVFEGLHCEIEVCTCSNEGVPYGKTGNCKCKCPEKWMGNDCEIGPI